MNYKIDTLYITSCRYAQWSDETVRTFETHMLSKVSLFTKKNNLQEKKKKKKKILVSLSIRSF